MLLELLFSLIGALKIDFTSQYPMEDIQELEAQINSQIADIF